ncbi:hypothetical protein ACU4GD_03225 [Cupriavidus basilensis]
MHRFRRWLPFAGRALAIAARCPGPPPAMPPTRPCAWATRRPGLRRRAEGPGLAGEARPARLQGGVEGIPRRPAAARSARPAGGIDSATPARLPAVFAQAARAASCVYVGAEAGRRPRPTRRCSCPEKSSIRLRGRPQGQAHRPAEGLQLQLPRWCSR